MNYINVIHWYKFIDGDVKYWNKIGSKGFKAKFTLELLKMDIMSKLLFQFSDRLAPDLAKRLFSKVGF